MSAQETAVQEEFHQRDIAVLQGLDTREDAAKRKGSSSISWDKKERYYFYF